MPQENILQDVVLLVRLEWTESPGKVPTILSNPVAIGSSVSEETEQFPFSPFMRVGSNTILVLPSFQCLVNIVVTLGYGQYLYKTDRKRYDCYQDYR